MKESLLRYMLTFVFGPIMVVAGWNAWTGRWRSWAHPYSGKGLLPLALLPTGLFAILSFFFDPVAEEWSLWEWLIMAPLTVATFFSWIFAGITMFYRLRWFPTFLRPRWLPPDWRPPIFVDVRSLAIKARLGPGLDPSSKEAAAYAAETHPGKPPDARRIAHWHAYYEEKEPELPFLHVALEGLRWCEISAYPHLVTIAQEVHEDRLREEPFVIPLQPGEVHTITFIPGERISWRSIRARSQFPRVVLETATAEHSLAFQPQLRKRIARDVAILERVFGVVARR